MQHDNLNEWLNKRAAPRAPKDLAERIVHAAAMAPKINHQTLWASIWKETLSMLVIPHPSVAVAAGVVLGVLIGMHASDGLSVLQQDWSSFLEINEGGWL